MITVDANTKGRAGAAKARKRLSLESFTVRLHPDTHKRLRERKFNTNASFQTMVEAALCEYLDAESGPFGALSRAEHKALLEYLEVLRMGPGPALRICRLAIDDALQGEKQKTA